MDLVATACAGSGDDVGGGGLADGGKEDEFTDVLGNIVVLGLVAEGSSHPHSL